MLSDTRSGIFSAGWGELPLNGSDQCVDVGGLNKIIVHLISNGLNGRIKSRISRQDDSHALWLRLAHRPHHNKAVTGFANIQVGKQNVETVILDHVQRFGHVAGGLRVETVLL